MKKMRTMIKPLVLLIALLFVLPIFAACSAESRDTGGAFPPGFSGDRDGVNAPDETPGEGSEDGDPSGDPLQDRKLTRTVDLRMETRQYEDLTASIEAEVIMAGGYIQTSSVSGDMASDNQRQATYSLRIPAEEADSFLEQIKTGGNVLSQSSKIEDITLQYVDTESRLEALRTEQETLMRILEDAETIEDIITIQDRLTNIRYQLETYEAQIRSMDNQVAYTVININVKEVRDFTQTQEEDFFSEARRRFTQAWKDMGDGLRSFSLNLISVWPLLLLLVIVIVLILIFGRTRKRRDRRTHHIPDTHKVDPDLPKPTDPEAPEDTPRNN